MFESPGSDTIKVVDFGTSTHFDNDTKLKKFLGTYEYLAPEVYSGRYDEKCDLWSIGCIIYVILTGNLPFEGEDIE